MNFERWHDEDEDSSYDAGDVEVSIINRREESSEQPVQPSRHGQHHHRVPDSQPPARMTMLVSSVLACPSTRAVIAIGDDALLEGCHDSNHDLGISGLATAAGMTLRRMHVNTRPPSTTTSIPITVTELDQDGDNNEARTRTNVLPPTLKRAASFTQLLDETNTTDDDLDDDDDDVSVSHLAVPPPGIRLWTTAKKE